MPGTRFAVEAYTEFCRSRSLAARPSPPRSPNCFRPMIINDGSRACWRIMISSARKRLPISRSARCKPSATAISPSTTSRSMRRHGREQDAVIGALEFKCSVLWAQLDALWSAYVDRRHSAWSLGARNQGGAAQRGGMTAKQAAGHAVKAASAARSPAEIRRDAGRMASARARAGHQGGCHRGRDLETLRRNRHLRGDRR